MLPECGAHISAYTLAHGTLPAAPHPHPELRIQKGRLRPRARGQVTNPTQSGAVGM